MSDIEKRIAMEHKVVAKLVEVAKAAGWAAVAVHDGERRVPCTTFEDVEGAVFSVDECHIIFLLPRPDLNSVRQLVQIVLGNDGYDCIADHSDSDDGFVANVMDPMQDYCDGLSEGLHLGS